MSQADPWIRVFIGQIPHYWTEGDIWSVLHMVFESKCREEVVGVTILRTTVGQHRGCAMVAFRAVDAALFFIDEMNGRVPTDGYRALRVRIAHADILRFGHGVLVRRVPRDSSWLWNYMSQYGRLLHMSDIEEHEWAVQRCQDGLQIIVFYTQLSHALFAVSMNREMCSLVPCPMKWQNTWIGSPLHVGDDSPHMQCTLQLQTPPVNPPPINKKMLTVRVGRCK